jgi:hypothetical protein
MEKDSLKREWDQSDANGQEWGCVGVGGEKERRV